MMTIHLTIKTAGMFRAPVNTDDDREREQAARVLENAAVWPDARRIGVTR